MDATAGQCLEIAAEIRLGLAGEPVNEIDVNQQTGGEQALTGFQGGCRTVPAVDALEDFGVQGLNAHADPANTASGEYLNMLRSQRFRRAFHGMHAAAC